MSIIRLLNRPYILSVGSDGPHVGVVRIYLLHGRKKDLTPEQPADVSHVAGAHLGEVIWWELCTQIGQ